KDCDLIIIIDNDVIASVDYIRNLATFLISQGDAGVVGAMIANLDYISYDVLKHYGEQGTFGNKILKITSAEIKKYILTDLNSLRFYFVGSHPDYIYAWFSPVRVFYDIINIILSFLKSEKQLGPINEVDYKKSLRDNCEKYTVSNVPGCNQAFKRTLIDEIGTLDDIFNPWGFEDVDFCIRAVRAGYINYMDTNTWIYHGTDTRHIKKDKDSRIEVYFKGLTILGLKVFKPRLLAVVKILSLIVFEYLFSLPLFNFKSAKAKFRGFLKGVIAYERQGNFRFYK
ncbi:MAG: hypothetical protein HQK93_09340, partial [Nitrospirae bacterium]|nr:hypothetical protein [Nitrospirota bacterium]